MFEEYKDYIGIGTITIILGLLYKTTRKNETHTHIVVKKCSCDDKVKDDIEDLKKES